MYDLPDARGHFGPYGGTFVPETLIAALQQLTAEYEKAKLQADMNSPEVTQRVERDLSDAKGNVIATYIKATFDGAPAHRRVHHGHEREGGRY